MASRFIEVGRYEQEDPIYVRKVTESQISSAVDMADCDDPGVMRKWFYVSDGGEFQEVTIGEQERINNDIECPFRYAASPIMAGGVEVGTVTHTDH